MGVAEVHVELPIGIRRIEEFTFHAPQFGVDVLVDRGAVHDLGDLEAVIGVMPRGHVGDHMAVEQRVLGTDFKGIERFRLERIGERTGEGWRVETARTVAAGVRRIDQSLIREIQLRRPIDHETAGQRMEGGDL